MRSLTTVLLCFGLLLLPVTSCSPQGTASRDSAGDSPQHEASAPGSLGEKADETQGVPTNPGARPAVAKPVEHPAAPTTGPQLLNADRPLSELLRPIEQQPISILIDKRTRTLTVRQGGSPVKTYPVVFGFNPVDDKLRQGDGCTPEGRFKIRDLYPHRSWSRFLWIDYPTQDSWRKHRLAKAEGRIAESAGIGGEIGIHGVPSGMDDLVETGQDWTLGCISLRNADVLELYRHSKRGTVVEIIGQTHSASGDAAGL